MSLPSIFDYLPDVAPVLMKIAAVEAKKEEPVLFSKRTALSALKTMVPYALGTGLGVGLGHAAIKGIEALEKHRGAPLIPPDMVIKYGPMALAALGGLAAAREYSVRKHERDLWRKWESAQDGTKNRAAGSATQ